MDTTEMVIAVNVLLFQFFPPPPPRWYNDTRTDSKKPVNALEFIAQTRVPFIAPRVAISRQIKHFCFVVSVIVVASQQIIPL